MPSKNQERRGASQTRRTAQFVIAERLVNQGAELTTPLIGINLRVPNLFVKTSKPISKRFQFVRVQILHLTFEAFQTSLVDVHASIIRYSLPPALL
jgi:hypothetical protein